jgi:hypothetical protein
MTASFDQTPKPRAIRDPLYASVIGLTSLAVLLQGLWAGLFVREGKDFDATSAQANWVQVHDWGARIAIVLAFASLVVAVWRLRARKEVLLGTGAIPLAAARVLHRRRNRRSRELAGRPHPARHGTDGAVGLAALARRARLADPSGRRAAIQPGTPGRVHG